MEHGTAGDFLSIRVLIHGGCEGVLIPNGEIVLIPFETNLKVMIFRNQSKNYGTLVLQNYICEIGKIGTDSML